MSGLFRLTSLRIDSSAGFGLGTCGKANRSSLGHATIPWSRQHVRCNQEVWVWWCWVQSTCTPLMVYAISGSRAPTELGGRAHTQYHLASKMTRQGTVAPFASPSQGKRSSCDNSAHARCGLTLPFGQMNWSACAPSIRSLRCHAAPSGAGNFVTGIIVPHEWPQLALASTPTRTRSREPKPLPAPVGRGVTISGAFINQQVRVVGVLVLGKIGRGGKGRKSGSNRRAVKRVTACARAVRCSLPFAAKPAAGNARLG